MSSNWLLSWKISLLESNCAAPPWVNTRSPRSHFCLLLSLNDNHTGASKHTKLYPNIANPSVIWLMPLRWMLREYWITYTDSSLYRIFQIRWSGAVEMFRSGCSGPSICIDCRRWEKHFRTWMGKTCVPWLRKTFDNVVHSVVTHSMLIWIYGNQVHTFIYTCIRWQEWDKKKAWPYIFI